MEPQFAISCGGCATIVGAGPQYLLIIGGEDLIGSFFVVSLIFDGITYNVGQQFDNVAGLITYLNTIFVSEWGFSGQFSFVDGQLLYLNADGRETGEILIKEPIVAVLGTENDYYIATEKNQLIKVS